MSSPSHAYLFLELAAGVYLLGFAGGYLSIKKAGRVGMLKTLFGLVLFWVLLDEIALGLKLWTFPVEGSFRLRLLGLPAEEYLVLVLHTLVCYVLVQRTRAEK